MVGEERRHDARGERGAQVEREVRHAHPVRDGAREPHGVRGAARRLGVVGRVAPQLERDRDRLAPGALDEQRRDRGVHPAAHRDERAARDRRRAPVAGAASRRRRGPPRRDGGAERDVERVRRQLGRVQLARREPAQLGRHLARADPRGVEHGRRREQLHGRGARRDRGAAAGRLEAGAGDPVAVERRSSRTRSPQAAPPAAPENDAGGT